MGLPHHLLQAATETAAGAAAGASQITGVSPVHYHMYPVCQLWMTCMLHPGSRAATGTAAGARQLTGNMSLHA